LNARHAAAALLALLLACRASAQAAPAPSGGSASPGGIALTAVRFSGLERVPPEAAAAARDPESWVRAMQARWQEGYAALVPLNDARASGAAAGTESGQSAAELEIEGTPSGFRTLVRLRTPEGRRLEARSSLAGFQQGALLSGLTGDLFFLWAQAGSFSLQPAQQPPPLTALLSLDSLALLPGWPAERAEPLDCAAARQGPILLFPGRLLSLDPDLNVSPATARDLCLRKPWPKDFRADRLFLTPLGQPLVYGSSSGQVLVYAPAGPPELLSAGIKEPTHAAALPRGGLAFLQGGTLHRLLRRGAALEREQLPLPVGFYAAIEGDSEGNYWLLDLAERRVRVFDATGLEIRSVKPVMDPARLPFPQVFKPLADGGLLLGGAGELWRFDAFGLPVWRLSTVFTGVREGLPPFFRVAAAGDLLYLLDPQGRRLYRFGHASGQAGGEAGTGGTGGARAGPQAAGGTGGAPAAGAADLLARFESGQIGSGELVQGLLARGLILAALPFFQASFPGASAGENQKLARRIKAQAMKALADLAQGYERELRLEEAEAAAAEGMRLARELRAEDPVEPSYAQSLRQLTEERNALREQLLPPAEGGPEAKLELAESGRLFLLIGNPGLEALGPLTVQARWAGLPGSPVVEVMEPIRPAYTVRLPLPGLRSTELERTEEDLSVSLSVLLRFERGGREQARYLRARFLRSPDGELRAGDFANPAE
jgi:hypothetical protein